MESPTEKKKVPEDLQMRPMPHSATPTVGQSKRALPVNMQRDFSGGSSMTRTITISAVDEQDITGREQALDGLLIKGLSLKNAEQFQQQCARQLNQPQIRRDKSTRRKWIAPAGGQSTPSNNIALRQRYTNLNKLSQAMRVNPGHMVSPRAVMVTSQGPRLGLSRGLTTKECVSKKDPFGMPIATDLSQTLRFEKSRTVVEKKAPAQRLGDDLFKLPSRQPSCEGRPATKTNAEVQEVFTFTDANEKYANGMLQKRKISFVNHRGQKLYQQNSSSANASQASVQKKPNPQKVGPTLRKSCLKAVEGQDEKDWRGGRYPRVLVQSMSKSKSEQVSSENGSLKRIQVSFDPYKTYKWPRNLISLTRKLKKSKGTEGMQRTTTTIRRELLLHSLCPDLDQVVPTTVEAIKRTSFRDEKYKAQSFEIQELQRQEYNLTCPIMKVTQQDTSKTLQTTIAETLSPQNTFTEETQASPPKHMSVNRNVQRLQSSATQNGQSSSLLPVPSIMQHMQSDSFRSEALSPTESSCRTSSSGSPLGFNKERRGSIVS